MFDLFLGGPRGVEDVRPPPGYPLQGILKSKILFDFKETEGSEEIEEQCILSHTLVGQRPRRSVVVVLFWLTGTTVSRLS